MKVFKRIMLSLIAILFVVVVSVIALFIYEVQFKKIAVYRESSPSEDYIFILYQVGQPGWPFGSVKAQIEGA